MGRILAFLLTTILLFGCGGDDKSSAPPATMPGTGSDTGVVLSENAALSISDSYLRVQAAPGVSVRGVYSRSGLRRANLHAHGTENGYR